MLLLNANIGVGIFPSGDGSLWICSSRINSYKYLTTRPGAYLEEIVPMASAEIAPLSKHMTPIGVTMGGPCPHSHHGLPSLPPFHFWLCTNHCDAVLLHPRWRSPPPPNPHPPPHTLVRQNNQLRHRWHPHFLLLLLPPRRLWLCNW